MITEFTFEILLFNDDKGFNVLYTPKNDDCTPISLWVKLPPLIKESEILDQLSKAAPQGEWQQQKDAKLVDRTVYENLVGKSVSANINSAPSLTANPFESNFVQEFRSNIV